MKGIIIIFSFFAFHTTFSQTVTLRDTTNQYDYIIITVPEFVSACEPFKQHKETVRGFNTLIVDTAQIFAEFDSSSTPQDNIRDFISYAGTFWKEPTPKNYLLAGNLSKISNFQSIIFDGSQYADTAYTDFKYSVSKYNQDTAFSSFSIGRLPANSITDIENYFNKVITFETDTIHSFWMNNNLFYSQYYMGDSVETYFEQTMNSFMNITPDYFNNNYYTENESSENFGNVDSVVNFLNTKGATSLWLIGGATYAQFGYNPLLTVEDISTFDNEPMFFTTVFIAKQFYGEDSSEVGLAVSLLFDNNSAIAVFAPVGSFYLSSNNVELFKLNQELFSITKKSIGAVLKNTRNYFGSPVSNNLVVLNLWGDPSLKLKYDITVDVEDFQEEIPADFTLRQNYPNPFNPSTKIKFVIPKSSFVNLKVYNVLGKEAATLVNEERPAGSYEVEFDASSLPSGVYFYQLRAGLFIQTKKMILLK